MLELKLNTTKMREDQTTEFKETWRDEYLKVLCSFANTEGGTLYVGIDDSGNELGILNANKLLEDLPNKISNILGILPKIKIEELNLKQILSIVVHKSLQPVSYHGVFYVRRGSTTQELKGNELHEFILKANNLTWDAIPIPEARFEELDDRLIRYFIGKAVDKNRLSIDAEFSNSFEVLQKLNLITQDNELTRAAILLFAKQPSKYIKGVAFKVGRFGTDSSDLISHDIVECPVFEMPDRVLELLKNKYLHSIVSYKGIERIETLEYPEKAIREAILNAVIHRDYASQGTEITLHVYDNQLEFWNIGSLLPPLHLEMLKIKHPSVKRNILIADVFYRSGAIEAWGRGIQLMITEAQKNNFPEPTFREYAGGMETVFNKMADDRQMDIDNELRQNINGYINKEINAAESVAKSVARSEKKIIDLIKENPHITQIELAKETGLSRRGVEKNISILKLKGTIQHKGSKKTGYWQIMI